MCLFLVTDKYNTLDDQLAHSLHCAITQYSFKTSIKKFLWIPDDKEKNYGQIHMYNTSIPKYSHNIDSIKKKKVL